MTLAEYEERESLFLQEREREEIAIERRIDSHLAHALSVAVQSRPSNATNAYKLTGISNSESLPSAL